MDSSNNLVKQQYYLLEKVEEQSLYIIELNNRLEKLERAGVKGISSPQTEEQTLYTIQLNDEIKILKQENEAIKQIICKTSPEEKICQQSKS